MRIVAAAAFVLPFVITTVTLLGLAQPASEGQTTSRQTQNWPEKAASPPGANVSSNFVIGPGDILQISVWQEPNFGETVEVRPDGKISLPLILDVEVAGLTPLAAQQRLTEKLQAFIKYPRVSVIVAEVHSRIVYVIGEVQRPGSYPMTGNLNVEQLIARAGGVTRHAKEKHVYVLHAGESSRVPVNYSKVLQGKAPEQNVELMPGDTVVVP